MNLTEIRVEVDDVGVPGHIGIGVYGLGGNGPEDYPGATMADLNSASHYLAGIFGLLAVALYPWFEFEAQRHRCHSAWYPPDPKWSPDKPLRHDGCQMDISPLGPVYDNVYPPGLQLTVPEEAVDEWRRRIKSSLRHIATCLS